MKTVNHPMPSDRRAHLKLKEDRWVSGLALCARPRQVISWSAAGQQTAPGQQRRWRGDQQAQARPDQAAG